MSKKRFNPSDMGKRIAKKRKELGMRQEDLAKKIGIGRVALNYIEKGTRAIKDSEIVLLANALQTDCDYLLTGTNADNVQIKRNLGLSNDAINALKESPNRVKLLNVLLSHETGIDILHLIESYIDIDRSTPTVRNKSTNKDKDLDYSDIVWFRKLDGSESDFGIPLGFLKDYIPIMIRDELKRLHKEIRKEEEVKNNEQEKA